MSHADVGMSNIGFFEWVQKLSLGPLISPLSQPFPSILLHCRRLAINMQKLTILRATDGSNLTKPKLSFAYPRKIATLIRPSQAVAYGSTRNELTLFSIFCHCQRCFASLRGICRRKSTPYRFTVVIWLEHEHNSGSRGASARSPLTRSPATYSVAFICQSEWFLQEPYP